MSTYLSRIFLITLFSFSSLAQFQLNTQLKCTQGKVRFVFFVDRTSANDGGKSQAEIFIKNKVLSGQTLQNFYIEPRQNTEISSTGLIFDSYWDRVLLEISSDEETSNFLSLDQQKDIGKLSDAIFKVNTGIGGINDSSDEAIKNFVNSEFQQFLQSLETNETDVNIGVTINKIISEFTLNKREDKLILISYGESSRFVKAALQIIEQKKLLDSIPDWPRRIGHLALGSPNQAGGLDSNITPSARIILSEQNESIHESSVDEKKTHIFQGKSDFNSFSNISKIIDGIFYTFKRGGDNSVLKNYYIDSELKLSGTTKGPWTEATDQYEDGDELSDQSMAFWIADNLSSITSRMSDNCAPLIFDEEDFFTKVGPNILIPEFTPTLNSATGKSEKNIKKLTIKLPDFGNKQVQFPTVLPLEPREFGYDSLTTRELFPFFNRNGESYVDLKYRTDEIYDFSINFNSAYAIQSQSTDQGELEITLNGPSILTEQTFSGSLSYTDIYGKVFQSEAFTVRAPACDKDTCCGSEEVYETYSEDGEVKQTCRDKCLTDQGFIWSAEEFRCIECPTGKFNSDGSCDFPLPKLELISSSKSVPDTSRCDNATGVSGSGGDTNLGTTMCNFKITCEGGSFPDQAKFAAGNSVNGPSFKCLFLGPSQQWVAVKGDPGSYRIDCKNPEGEKASIELKCD